MLYSGVFEIYLFPTRTSHQMEQELWWQVCVVVHGKVRGEIHSANWGVQLRTYLPLDRLLMQTVLGTSLFWIDSSVAWYLSNYFRSGIALISEDDIVFPFDIDFVALAASAPPDFGILQLFNSNPSSMKETWKRYTKVCFLLSWFKINRTDQYLYSHSFPLYKE